VKLRVVSFVLLGTFIAGPTQLPATARPQTQEEIERRLEEIARLRRQLEEREAHLRRGISDAGERREVLTTELEELQAVVDEVQRRVNDASAVLSRIQGRVDEKSDQVRLTERALEGRLAKLRARAVEVYKQGPASLLDMVVGAHGFEEFLRRFAYMLQIVRTDNEHVAEIRRIRAEIVRERDAITKLRDQAARQMSVVVAERNHAASVAGRVDAQRRAVIGDLESRYGQLGDVQRQKERYERETAELQAESAAIAAFLRGHGTGTATVSPKGMIWPVSGPVTSGYGWRTHPIFHTRRFHAGIDIGAPSGTPIMAAGTGEVIYASAKAGYGNTVIIDHGGGIATLYAHQSAIVAGVGAVVARGATIGRVGCTGYCTGPHLHFEVRVNGDPVNPLGWLP
jgi:murein DD-endopeptidase MepM/ murein hydrolase activator NlpD